MRDLRDQLSAPTTVARCFHIAILSMSSNSTSLIAFVQPTPTTPSSKILPPAKILIPDLVSHCTFPLRYNRHRKQATAQSVKWLLRGDQLSPQRRKAYYGLKAGLLTSMCYPDAGFPQLRVCCDFMNYLFHLDNLSDDMDKRGTQATADVVLNSLYHPNTWKSPARVGKMTREWVSLFVK